MFPVDSLLDKNTVFLKTAFMSVVSGCREQTPGRGSLRGEGFVR